MATDAAAITLPEDPTRRLLLLHGWDHSPAHWVMLQRWIARDNIEIICPDLRELALASPYGAGTLERSQWIVDELIKTYMRDGVSWIAGHSAGAQLAVRVATTRRSRVVLIDPIASMFEITTQPTKLVSALSAERRAANSDALDELRGQITLLRGEHSALFPRDVAVSFAQRLNARLQAVPAAGHSPHLDNPEALATELARTFLEERHDN